MEIQIKSDGHSKENKNSLFIGKNSSNRRISKTSSKQSYLKGTSASKSHLPRIKTTPIQKLPSITDAQNGKSGASKPLVKLSSSTNKTSKELERHKIKPVNVIRQKSATKPNMNLLKSTTKSVKAYRNNYSPQTFEPKRDLKNNDILAAIKIDNKVSPKTKIIGNSARGVITATKELAMLTEVDHKISQENTAQLHTKSNEKRGYFEGNKPSYMTGAVPKISKQDIESVNAGSMREKSTSKNKNGNESDEDEEELEKVIPISSFHRDRIAETLKELDQQMESENSKSMLKPSKNYIKEEKTTMKKKNSKSKKASRKNHEEEKDDKLNDFENTLEVPNDTPYGLKKIDKYLCSLSGGEAQKLPHRNDTQNLDAIDVTEKIHTPTIHLEAQSFPHSSNTPRDSDVNFLLGNSAASKISSSQKSIAEKWKQKPVSPTDSQTTTSTEYQCNSMEKNNVVPDVIKDTIKDVDKDQIIRQDDPLNLNAAQKQEESIEENDIIEEFSCPICYEVLLVPQQLDPCKHIFCDPCLRRMADAPRTEPAGCPMCRSEIKSCTTNQG